MDDAPPNAPVWQRPSVQMADLVAQKDWSATPLGPRAGWSQSLELAVGIIMASAFPMALRWGPEFVLIYNDGYQPILGEKHPWALGLPAREAWSEVWDQLVPVHRDILEGRSPAVFAEDMQLRIQRYAGRWDEASFTLSYSPVPDTTAPSGIGGVLITAVETTVQVQARRQLVEERRHLADLFRQAPGFICVLDGPNHRFELANDSYRDLVGGRDVVGKTVAEALPEVVEQGFTGLLDHVYTSGVPFVGNAVPIVLDGPDGPARLFVDFIYQPIRDGRGEITGIFVEGMDVTERSLAAERQRLLVNELNHRVKNSLATVQSLAAQTLRSAGSVEDARHALEDRLLSLARAHDMLTRESWSGADLEEVVQAALAPFVTGDDGRVGAGGTDVRLSAGQALALSMALHELATNAAKYGALSTPAGRVAVSWTADDGELHIVWKESGGPAVGPQGRRGFGSRLLERGLPAELGGRVTRTFEQDGVRCDIWAPLHPRAQDL